MSKEFYHVYSKGLLGVKTNVDGFRWAYGSAAPVASVEEYEKCTVKLNVCVKPENEMGSVGACDKRFQSYTWDAQRKTISCRRTLFHKFKIGFNIRISENTVYAEIGRHYYKYVQNRTMNLHGMYYLLSDLANVLLLKNGFLTLYASAVHKKEGNRGIVQFAPPNTGKTLTATRLCESLGYKLVGEDVVITDGSRVYSCPWTTSYRKNSMVMDNAGSLGRVNKAVNSDFQEECSLTDLMVLALGEQMVNTDKEEIFEQICILNGYLFGYYSTPIVKMLAYFDEDYRTPWNNCAAAMIREMVNQCNCRLIQAKTPVEFFKIVDVHETSGEI